MKKLIITIAILLSTVHGAYGDDVSLTDVEVSLTPEMRLTFKIEGAFKEGIVDAINSGIPTSFTFLVKLYRVRPFWPDEGVGSWRFNHTVKYDALKEEYEVFLDEHGASVRTKSFEEMKLVMVTGNAISINPAPHIVPGDRYKLRVKAELEKIKLPLFLDYIFLFVKLWDFETSWHTVMIEPVKIPTATTPPAATPTATKPSGAVNSGSTVK